MLSIVGAGLTVGGTFVPGTANSAAPGFGNWSVSGGDISTSCPTGFTCTPIVTGKGFLQAQVTDASGNSYVWTVVTDTNASGTPPGTTGAVPFSDENFVVTNNSAVTGVADQQSITDASNGNFASTVSVLTGFAAPSSGNQVQISQTLNKNTGGTTAFSTTFDMTVALDTSGNQTGRSMNIDQSTFLNSTTDKQAFAIRERQGTFTTTHGSLTLGAGTAAQTVNWGAGDDVMLSWVGQGLTLSSSGTGGLAPSTFGFEGITNNTTNSQGSTFSQTDLGPSSPTPPFSWPGGDFGTAPSY